MAKKKRGRGRPSKHGETTNFNLRLPVAMYGKICAEADRDGVSINDRMIELLGPRSRLWYIEYSTPEEILLDYFSKRDYLRALDLLEESDDHDVISHGRYQPPQAENLNLWKEHMGFGE